MSLASDNPPPQSPTGHDGRNGHVQLMSPWVVGSLAAIAVGSIVLGIVVLFHLRFSAELEARMLNSLRRAAIAAAQSVDPAVHASLVDPSQEGSRPYDDACRRLERTRAEFEGPEKLHFIYTCVLRGDQVFFVLDPTPAGDADGDGVDDKAHLMEPYEDAVDELRETLRSGRTTVMKEPYTDKWGTFLSAYAPIFDNEGTLIAAAGVDMDLDFFSKSLRTARNENLMAAAFGMILAIAVGAGAALYQNRLIKSVDGLNHAMEQAKAGQTAKDRFLAAISHEFRTPMNAIAGSAQLLQDTALDPFQQEQTRTIIGSSGALLAMLDDVLAYARLSTGRTDLKLEPVDLRSMLENVVAPFREEAGRKGLVLGADVDPDVPSCWTTSLWSLQKVLKHLVSNGVKFTSGGEVRAHVTLATDAEGRNALRFEVSDTGVGMKPDEIRRLFQPFTQLDSSLSRHHEGTGLGLALCRELCRVLGTSLDVESTPGKGSVFRFLLPGEAAAVPPPAEVAPQSAAGHAILISRDRLQRGILSRLLEKRGWKVSVAENLDNTAGLPDSDCVIFDLAEVPGGDSVVYARQVASLLPAACHVAIDAGLDERTRTNLLKSGVRAVISRSLQATDLEWLTPSPGHQPV